jgi:hypothetical protein
MKRHLLGVGVGVLFFGGLSACGTRAEDLPAVEADTVTPEDRNGTPGWQRKGLHWYTTCGGPICVDPPPDVTVPDCPVEGTPCKRQGDTCGDPATSLCGSIVVCDDHDPKAGGCPISTRKAKKDIAYLDDAELARLHDETLRMKLATYRYKGRFIDPNDPDATHLGFIVEDQPQSLSVDRGHDRVDLYGYMSMAVATLQVQERRIEAQQRRIDALERELAARRSSHGRSL